MSLNDEHWQLREKVEQSSPEEVLATIEERIDRLDDMITNAEANQGASASQITRVRNDYQNRWDYVVDKYM